MKNKKNFMKVGLAVLVSLFILPVHAEYFLIDQIERVIYGPGFPEATGLRDTTAIITKSDLERVGLDGQPRTMEKLIFESLVYLDAKKYRMEDEKLVDRYIEAVKAQNNLSLDDIKKMFHDSGYTYEEGREQLAKYNTINQLLDFKVRSKVIVAEREAREYYEAHPLYEPAAYQLERIFVPFRTSLKSANTVELPVSDKATEIVSELSE